MENEIKKLIEKYNKEYAECLNGGEHKYEPTKTIPVEAIRLRCTDCGDEKPLEDK